MGSSKSTLKEDILDEYTVLSYLSKAEILHLYKLFDGIDKDGKLQQDDGYRFPVDQIEQNFPQLKFNPFKERIFKVFSSQKDNRLSFEDMLDLCSVMSEKCPEKVKAAWAFRIFDFDEDGNVGEKDLMTVIDLLVGHSGQISEDEKKHIIKMLIEGMDFEGVGCVGQLGFQHAVGKIPEFPHSFCFRL